jgi:hypothetical protein
VDHMDFTVNAPAPASHGPRARRYRR